MKITLTKKEANDFPAICEFAIKGERAINDALMSELVKLGVLLFVSIKAKKIGSIEIDGVVSVGANYHSLLAPCVAMHSAMTRHLYIEPTALAVLQAVDKLLEQDNVRA